MNLLLNGDRDIFFPDNKMTMVTGLDEMRQIVDNALTFFEEEWFLDLTLGVPYYQRIFIKGISELEVEVILTSYVSNLLGVMDILKYESVYDVEKRTIAVSMEIKTLEGILDFSTEQLGT